jgi:hypothetical protein
MRFEINWELISSDYTESITWRAKVIGGWLVNHILNVVPGQNPTESMVFVPDKNHLWETQSFELEDDGA